MEKMTRPSYTSWNCRKVTNNLWTWHIFLVLFFDWFYFISISLEQQDVLLIKIVFKIFSSKNCFEFSKKLKRVFDWYDILETSINILLKICFNWWNSNIKLNEITIKCVLLEIKKLMILFLESINILFKSIQYGLNILKVVFF